MATNSTNFSTMVIFFTLSFLLFHSPLASSYENSPSPSPSSDDKEYIYVIDDSSPSPSPLESDSIYDSPSISAPSSDDSDYEYNDKLSPEFKTFVQKCGEKLQRKCGKEIRNDLLDVERVSNSCCEELVNMGWICHKGMMRMAVGSLYDKEAAAKIISNNNRVYYRCLGIINNIAPSV